MPNNLPRESCSFAVKFGKVARAVEYCDDIGPVQFTFEPEVPGMILTLEHHAPRRGRTGNYDVAFARTKTFLENAGYAVREVGQAKMPVPMTEGDVAGWVRAQPGWASLINISWREAPTLEWFDGGQGDTWALWTVAVALGRPGERHKIVFDEMTRHFGVVDAANDFLGFWGSLRETVDAVSPSNLSTK